MALSNGPTLIDPPPAPPRPYGIFDVALGPLPFPNEGSVGGGVIYVPDTCEDDFFLATMTCPPVSGLKTFSPVEVAVSGDPFAVYTSYTCGAIGFDFDEAERRVRTRMSLREQTAVEKRIWSGWTAGSGNVGALTGLLRNAVNLGPAGCVTEAIELLEQQLANSRIVGGIIHARPGLSPHLANNHLLEHGPGRQLNTPLGTPYVFGQGYDGTGPTGQATDTSQEWMYASGRMIIWRDETRVFDPRQTMDKAGNQLFVLGEQVFAVAVECGVWAVNVTRTCTTSGGGT